MHWMAVFELDVRCSRGVFFGKHSPNKGRKEKALANVAVGCVQLLLT